MVIRGMEGGWVWVNAETEKHQRHRFKNGGIFRIIS